MYEEIVLGFFLMLYFSDAYYQPYYFAQFVKPYYLLFVSFFLFTDRDQFSTRNNFFSTFIPFFLVAVVALFDCYYFKDSFEKTLSYFLLYFSIPNYVTKIYLDKGPALFKNLIVIVVVLLGIANFYYYMGWSPVGGGRFKGFFGNPNGMGLHLSTFFLFFMVVRHYFFEMFNRFETWLIYGIVGISLYYCGSRNSLFSIALFLFFYRFYLISPGLGFFIFASVLLSYEYINDNYTFWLRALGLGRYLREETLETGSGRVVAWEFGWEEIQKHPYIGKGFGFDPYIYYADGNQERLNLLGTEGASHNSYIALTLNSGFIGLGTYLFGVVAKVFKGAKNSIIAFPFIYGSLFSATFESWLSASLNPFNILFLMSLVIMTTEELNYEERQAPVSIL